MKKMQKAIKSLIDQKIISLGAHKGSEADYIDRVDLAIRVLLNMCRQLKQKTPLRNRVLRNLGSKERSRVTLVLETVQLPPERMEADMEDFDDTLAELPVPPALAFEPAPVLAIEDRPPAYPNLFKKLKSAESSGTMVKPSSIFQKILNRKATEETVALQAVPSHACQAKGSNIVRDETLLAEAMAFQPKQSLVEPKKKPQKKKDTEQTKKKKKPVPKSKSKKKGTKNGSSSKKAPQTKDPTPKQKKKAKAKAPAPPTPGAEEPILEKDSMPDFAMELKPRETDNYKNQFASRQHHKAFDHALRWGKSKEDASLYARSIAAKAREIWYKFNPG
eukprot:Skav202722  [mRNA]  locus=scaffold3646:12995:14066:+ [translate_table: standard]